MRQQERKVKCWQQRILKCFVVWLKTENCFWQIGSSCASAIATRLPCTHTYCGPIVHFACMCISHCRLILAAGYFSWVDSFCVFMESLQCSPLSLYLPAVISEIHMAKESSAATSASSCVNETYVINLLFSLPRAHKRCITSYGIIDINDLLFEKCAFVKLIVTLAVINNNNIITFDIIITILYSDNSFAQTSLKISEPIAKAGSCTFGDFLYTTCIQNSFKDH